MIIFNNFLVFIIFYINYLNVKKIIYINGWINDRMVKIWNAIVKEIN